MPDRPSSPGAARLATPSWLDARLVLGVLLVLVSVVVGARLLSRADDRQSVWVLTRDLAAGSTLAEGDLQAGQVRLFDAGARYVLASGAKPVGYLLQRAVGRGELLPRDSLVRPDGQAPALRDVSVSVAVGHLPDDLQPGQQVDVYTTAGDRTASTTARTPSTSGPATGAAATGVGATASDGSGTVLVLPRLTVTLRPRGATGATQSVVLSVPVADVPRLVAAGQAGGVDLVRVARGDERPTLPPVAPAAATR